MTAVAAAGVAFERAVDSPVDGALRGQGRAGDL
jgi:hypothetical protein